MRNLTICSFQRVGPTNAIITNITGYLVECQQTRNFVFMWMINDHFHSA